MYTTQIQELLIVIEHTL